MIFNNKFLISALLITNWNSSLACTTLLVGKNATIEGNTVIARTSDTIDTRRAKNLKIFYDKNSKKSYIGLPYWDTEDDKNNEMSQVSTNAYGVSLSATQTIRSNSTVMTLDAPSGSIKGVSEINIPALVMPFATTARKGVSILGNAIEERGLASTKGFGVLFADKNEAWYLESLSGHQWVAIKIPKEVYFIAANGPGQIQEYVPARYEYQWSHFLGKSPIEFALENNIAQKNNSGDFDFRRTFADVKNSSNYRKNFVRIAYVQHQLNPKTRSFDLNTVKKDHFPMFLEPENKISIDDIKIILANHYQENAGIDPYASYDNLPSKEKTFRSIACLNTSNAHITIVDKSLAVADPNIDNLEYIALGMPTLSFYLPIYYGITKIPEQLKGATNHVEPDKDTLFWQFRKLQALAFISDPERNIQYNPYAIEQIIQKNYKKLAIEVEQERLLMEEKYAKSKNRQFIDDFTAKTVNKLSNLNNELIKNITNQLKINDNYNLKTKHEEARWFTNKVHEQECHFKPKRATCT